MALEAKLVGKAFRAAADIVDPPPKTPGQQTGPVSPPPTPPVSPTLNVSPPMWLGDWSGDVWSFVHNAVTTAAGKTSLFILYDIPGRDNGNYSAGGLKSPAEYYAWTGKIADAIGNASAIAVVEPDALGLSSQLSDDKKNERFGMIQGAINALNAKPNIKIYVDASMWVSPQDMATLLKKFTGLDGFSVNTSGYAKTTEVIAWADQVATLTGLHYVIDTSRNGNGNPHAPNWCNVTDTKIGTASTATTASRMCDAYLWLKVPGESDGLGINDDGSHPRNDVPSAGTYWPEYHDAIYSGDWTAFKKKYRI